MKLSAQQSFKNDNMLLAIITAVVSIIPLCYRGNDANSLEDSLAVF